ncbi:evolutionarily conserved signaling intermediate in Toll pathway, mitochondrial [Protopterus annectens]|uniref:evolutionarily conserved signaling intermediate in Toll pathway, mitochondrial n=1 Tax=Protopterus annectens TaxID=7888 RepID=UPI001CFBB0A6|nr:evolutionarily conserved signaling intermediate in Toll pathway, mitochondrial [Protopterus annectens]XP_043940569.1 evolutionarily conserved signaling intermediate in Toll pathway, mitochondrial [Protopterus annectens]
MSCIRTLLLVREPVLFAVTRKELIRFAVKCTSSQLQVLARCTQNVASCTPKTFHTSTWASMTKPTVWTNKNDKGKDSSNKALVTYDDLFEKAGKESKTKATFNKVLDVFCRKDIRRRGHVEFIYTALRKMPEFGVERDITVYNKILEIFPKEVFVPHNFIQRMFNHYPRQQECGVEVLEQMENYGVMPNTETKVLLIQIFGRKSHPVRKFQRILYWFPKFKHVNQYPVPDHLPVDPVDLSRICLQRIAADMDAKVTVYQMPSLKVSEDGQITTQSHIVGIQSPDQQCLLAKHNPERPVFLEGPFPLWLKATCVYYYILRADPLPPGEKEEERIDPERNFYYPMELDFDLERDLGDDLEYDVDEVEEGPVFALCMAGDGDQATLAKWISGLQWTNPVLGRTPVIFRLSSGLHELQTVTESDHNNVDEVLLNQKMKQ